LWILARTIFTLAGVKVKQRPVIAEQEQALLDGVQVRVLDPAERERFDQLLIQEHYLKATQLVGEQVRYVAEYQGQWVGMLAWSAGAYKLKRREQWIGWSDRQKKRRLALVVNNSRFVILKAFAVPNLASRVMKLCLDRLSQDWTNLYGHEVWVAESFVDSQRFLGTCYKASGWTLLGQTQGYGRCHEDFYQAHDRPKQLWVRELRPGARTVLRGRNVPEALRPVEAAHPPECPQSPEELERMCRFFAGLTDWRRRKPDYPLSSLVAVSVCALLCKVCLGQRDLAAFAADLTVDQMAALRFPRDWHSYHRRYLPPSESTFFRMLSHLHPRELEKALLAWQDQVLGKRDPQGDRVAVDGKELINSQGLQIANAYSVQDGRWLGSEPVADDSNEIPAVQELLRRVDIEGALVTADALNTQTETARIIVQERGADYLFTVKGNQKGVADNVRQLYQGLSHAFSPSRPNGHRPDLRTQSRSHRGPLPHSV
jgi:hypothetical protein